MAFCYITRSLLFLVALQNCAHYVYADVQKGQKPDISGNEKPQSCINTRCLDIPPRTCNDIYSSDPRAAVSLSAGYEVFWDTDTDGGGWIVIQRRIDKEIDFNRKWLDYKYGFGNITGNFWFGNEKIHRLTVSRPYELRVDMIYNGTEFYAKYSHFRIFGESEKYQLDLDGFSGNAGDSLSVHNGMGFSTFDRDNDVCGCNCANHWHGAWWYRECYSSNLNGVWGSKISSEGLNWHSITGYDYSVTFSEMKIRPIIR